MIDEVTTAGTAETSHVESDALARVTAAVAELIAGVPGDGWTAPTLCLDWNVRQLLQHLVAGNLAGAAILARRVPPAGSVDRLGDDPLAAFRGSAAQPGTAFAAPGVLQAGFRSPGDLAEQEVGFTRATLTDEIRAGGPIERAQPGRRSRCPTTPPRSTDSPPTSGALSGADPRRRPSPRRAWGVLDVPGNFG